MIRFRPLLMMTLMTLIALVVLIALGRWQWQRYETKRALANTPVAEMTLSNYQPIENGIQFVFGVRAGPDAGWRVFAPVRMGDAVVFVDADFIDGEAAPVIAEVRAPASLRYGAPVRGAMLRPGPPARFAPKPQLEKRLWYDVDLPAMGRRAGLANVADYYIATTYVGADGRAQPNPFARLAGADSLPPERHLGYALTWWGIAAVLIGIYLAYHVSEGRLFFAPRETEE
jgi:surfeit locus 1 family protein